MRRRAAVLLATLLLGGCLPAPAAAPFPTGTAWLDRLYLGRSVPGRDPVSDADWERFLHETVTPRFPSGYTVLRGEGRWRGAADTTEAERSFVLEVVHPGDSTSHARMLEVGAAYRQRFHQEAVLRVLLPVRSTLLH